MTQALLNRLTSTSTMLDAERELIALGPAAVPVLANLLSGESTNEYGVAYRSLGLPLRCALEVARRLGPISRPLEGLLRAELRSGNFVAAQALGALGFVDESTIEELVAHLDYDFNQQNAFPRALDLTAESAVALLRLGHEDHLAVQAALTHSKQTSQIFNSMKVSIQKQEVQNGAGIQP